MQPPDCPVGFNELPFSQMGKDGSWSFGGLKEAWSVKLGSQFCIVKQEEAHALHVAASSQSASESWCGVREHPRPRNPTRRGCVWRGLMPGSARNSAASLATHAHAAGDARRRTWQCGSFPA